MEAPLTRLEGTTMHPRIRFTITEPTQVDEIGIAFSLSVAVLWGGFLPDLEGGLWRGEYAEVFLDVC